MRRIVMSTNIMATPTRASPGRRLNHGWYGVGAGGALMGRPRAALAGAGGSGTWVRLLPGEVRRGRAGATGTFDPLRGDFGIRFALVRPLPDEWARRHRVPPRLPTQEEQTMVVRSAVS